MSRRLFYIVLVGLLFVPALLKGQWVANPEKAKRLIVDNYAPYDIITLENPEYGAFIVWQDKREVSPSVLLFQSIDVNGKARVQADGKRVTQLVGEKETPDARIAADGTVYVVWKDFTHSATGDLYLQKIQANGYRLFGDYGLKISRLNSSTTKYSLAIDANDNAWICMIEKRDSMPTAYTIKTFKIASDGSFDPENDVRVVHSSAAAKYDPGVTIGKAGKATAFWLESKAGKNVLMMQVVPDSLVSSSPKPALQVSAIGENVLSYTINPVRKDRIFLTWQISGKAKEVKYQILGSRGTGLLPEPAKICSRAKGSKVSFQVKTTPDSCALVGWVQENVGKRNLFLKKFTADGRSEWGDTASGVTKLPINILGFSYCLDKLGNTVVTWLERNDKEKHLDIMAQKLNNNGKIEWGNSGYKILSSTENDKSYLTVVNYARQSVAAIYREKNKLETVIYGQRLFAEQKGISVFADVNTQVENDSIVVSWRMQNESLVKSYHIEKFLLKTARDTSWSEVAVVPAKPFSGNNDYRYSFVPDSDGVYFIRVVQQLGNGVLSVSENQKVSYLKDFGDNIVLLQNNPNPFSDSTTIMYYLPYPMTVHFEIYNSRIERIDEFYVRNAEKGRNKYVFSARNLAEGVYFYRFTAGNTVEVKKMVITR